MKSVWIQVACSMYVKHKGRYTYITVKEINNIVYIQRQCVTIFTVMLNIPRFIVYKTTIYSLMIAVQVTVCMRITLTIEDCIEVLEQSI